jgi:hypothetical protein
LAHFALVTLSLLMAFVLVAHVLFGSQINGFNTPLEALDTVFLCILGYVFDDISADMFEVGSTLGIVWSVIFSIVMILLILNMVLTIIFDVYAEAKEEAANSPSLLHQTWCILKEKHEQAQRIREIEAELKEEEEIRREVMANRSVRGTLADDVEEPDVDVIEEPAVIDVEVLAEAEQSQADTGAGLAPVSPVKTAWKGSDEHEQEPDPERSSRHNSKTSADPARKQSKGSEGKTAADQSGRQSKGSEKPEGSHSLVASFRESVHHAEEAIQATAHHAIEESMIVGRMIGDELQEGLHMKWSHSSLYDALSMQDLHEEEIVTMESLMHALGAHANEAPFMRYVIEQAQETSSSEHEAGCISLIDSIRLIGRVDANSRNLEEDARAAIRQLQLAKVQERKEKTFTTQEHFSRIEDAVCGLTHKISKLDSSEEGTPLTQQAYAAWPPRAPATSIMAWS